MSKITHPLMRYPGGKFRLAPWIISFFPDHKTYVEPFGGAAGVLLQKPRAMGEVYNDLDGDIVNIFRVLQDKEQAADLQFRLSITPYAREEFNLSYEPTTDSVERARRTLIRAQMGFGSAGSVKRKTGFRLDSARKYGTSAHLWARYPAKIGVFVERLESVIIENRPAGQVIDNHDRPDTLFFLDPPYVHATRNISSGVRYRHEMQDEDHAELLDQLNNISGMAIISGYDSEIYNDMLRGWERHSTTSRISAARGSAVREEVVWLNPACAAHKPQQQLFG